MNMSASEDYFNMKLVREVEKYPLLYNFNVAEYSKRDACDESWEKVAMAMNDTGKIFEFLLLSMKTVDTKCVRYWLLGCYWFEMIDCKDNSVV